MVVDVEAEHVMLLSCSKVCCCYFVYLTGWFKGVRILGVFFCFGFKVRVLWSENIGLQLNCGVCRWQAKTSVLLLIWILLNLKTVLGSCRKGVRYNRF